MKKKATKSTKVTKSVGSRVPRDRTGNVLAAKDAKVAKAGGRDDLIAPRVVLVGTYKGDQLTKWRGWYNYPISEDDKIGAEDAAMITELWLFNGKKNQRSYKAEFVGIKTRKELIDDCGYPAKGKAHGREF